MAITITTSSEYKAISETIIAEARFTEEYAAPMRGLVTPFTMAQGASTFRVPRFNTLVAAGLTEGVDMTDSQDIKLSYVDLTTSEAGLKVILTKKLMREINENMLSVAGKLMGDAIGRYIDEQLLALFDGFSSSLGAAGKILDEEVLAAVSLLLASAKAIGPYCVVLHPNCYWTYMKALAAATVTYGLQGKAAEAQVAQFYVGRMPMFGTTLWHDSNFTIDASDDIKGAAFGKEALAFTSSMEETSDLEKDASLRGIEVVHVIDFGVAELLDTSGIELYFDATAPAPTGD